MTVKIAVFKNMVRLDYRNREQNSENICFRSSKIFIGSESVTVRKKPTVYFRKEETDPKTLEGIAQGHSPSFSWG